MRSRLPIFAALIVMTVGVSSCAANAKASWPPIGTNLNGLSYWSTELPFLDVFKTSSAWVSGTRDVWSDGQRLDLDERGWVRSLNSGQVANKVLLTDTVKFRGALARRYLIDYDGIGRLEYGELARLIEHREHRDVIEIDEGKGNATLTLTSTDPKDYIRNIRMMPDGVTLKPGEVFNPIFLERLDGYRVLRFMIWMLGDSSADIAARRWGARPVQQDAVWTIKGAPLETMVALSNRVQADPWFTVPHAADNDYVWRVAELVKTSLDPRLKVYLEYSNEVWNDTYPQTAYAREQGLVLGLSSDSHEATLRFYARRSVEIFSIFEQMLGKDRIVRVLSFQSDSSPEYAEDIALAYGDTRSHVDVVAIGPYFGTDLAPDAAAVERIRNFTLEDLFRELANSSLPRAKEEMRAHAAVARKYGLPLVAYEGGQHLWNTSGQVAPGLEAVFNAANRDARMGALYSRYLRDWADVGGGLFMHLLDCGSFDNAGNWGALEYITQPRADAPKYDTLQRFIEGRDLP